MKIILNTHLNIAKTSPSIYFTRKTGQNNAIKRAVAGASAALMLASSAAPMAGTLSYAPIGIYNEQKSNFATIETMQKMTQRLFEIEAELAFIGVKFENNFKKESNLLERLHNLYTEKREAKTDEEKEKIEKEIASTEEEWFKNVTEFGALDAQEMILNSQKIWLQEELYRLQSQRTGSKAQYVQMPYSERYYSPDGEEVMEKIAQSSKNNDYILFLEDILSECKNNSTISIKQKVLELNVELDSLKPLADRYLKALEQHRIDFNKAVAPIASISKRIKEIEENSPDSLENNQEYLELKSKLKSHQAKRDELAKNWNDFAKENKPGYDNYQQTLLKIIVLENYLNEVYTF